MIDRPPRRLLPTARRQALALGLAALAAGAAAEEVSEYGIKAVLFYRLAQFVYWPSGEEPAKPTVLCVAGKNPFGPAIKQLQQAGDGTELRLAPADPRACHLLFIARSESATLEHWLSRSEGRRTVTVSDIPGFARAGGMIELPLEGNRVTILINRANAAKRGIDFNAQLLRLARMVAP